MGQPFGFFWREDRVWGQRPLGVGRVSAAVRISLELCLLCFKAQLTRQVSLDSRKYRTRDSRGAQLAPAARGELRLPSHLPRAVELTNAIAGSGALVTVSLWCPPSLEASTEGTQLTRS